MDRFGKIAAALAQRRVADARQQFERRAAPAPRVYAAPGPPPQVMPLPPQPKPTGRGDWDRTTRYPPVPAIPMPIVPIDDTGATWPTVAGDDPVYYEDGSVGPPQPDIRYQDPWTIPFRGEQRIQDETFLRYLMSLPLRGMR